MCCHDSCYFTFTKASDATNIILLLNHLSWNCILCCFFLPSISFWLTSALQSKPFDINRLTFSSPTCSEFSFEKRPKIGRCPIFNLFCQVMAYISFFSMVYIFFLIGGSQMAFVLFILSCPWSPNGLVPVCFSSIPNHFFSGNKGNPWPWIVWIIGVSNQSSRFRSPHSWSSISLFSICLFLWSPNTTRQQDSNSLFFHLSLSEIIQHK